MIFERIEASAALKQLPLRLLSIRSQSTSAVAQSSRVAIALAVQAA
jgi:hypothetical protein